MSRILRPKARGRSNPPIMIPHFTEKVKGFLKKNAVILRFFSFFRRKSGKCVTRAVIFVKNSQQILTIHYKIKYNEIADFFAKTKRRYETETCVKVAFDDS